MRCKGFGTCGRRGYVSCTPARQWAATALPPAQRRPNGLSPRRPPPADGAPVCPLVFQPAPCCRLRVAPAGWLHLARPLHALRLLLCRGAAGAPQPGRCAAHRVQLRAQGKPGGWQLLRGAWAGRQAEAGALLCLAVRCCSVHVAVRLNCPWLHSSCQAERWQRQVPFTPRSRHPGASLVPHPAFSATHRAAPCCLPLAQPDSKTVKIKAEVLAAGGTWRDVARTPEAGKRLPSLPPPLPPGGPSCARAGQALATPSTFSAPRRAQLGVPAGRTRRAGWPRLLLRALRALRSCAAARWPAGQPKQALGA